MAVNVARLLETAENVKPPAEEIEALRKHYTAYRCAQIAGLCDVSELREAARTIYEELRAEPVVDAQEHADESGTLGYGFRLQRLDVKSESVEHATRVESVFREHGLVDWADRIARVMVPVINEITDHDLEFSRLFLLAYREGDYIGPHGAEQDFEGNRFNLQFPLCYDAVGSMRVLKHGYLELMYDRDGDARLLGPRMWHEVPPLLRLPGGHDPLRLVVSLRLNVRSPG